MASGHDDIRHMKNERSARSHRSRKTMRQGLLSTIQQTKVQANTSSVFGDANLRLPFIHLLKRDESWEDCILREYPVTVLPSLPDFLISSADNQGTNKSSLMLPFTSQHLLISQSSQPMQQLVSYSDLLHFGQIKSSLVNSSFSKSKYLVEPIDSAHNYPVVSLSNSPKPDEHYESIQQAHLNNVSSRLAKLIVLHIQLPRAGQSAFNGGHDIAPLDSSTSSEANHLSLAQEFGSTGSEVISFQGGDGLTFEKSSKRQSAWAKALVGVQRKRLAAVVSCFLIASVCI
ncbi:unnamed protein product [Protopolystoma xenopodis]|uniref:Uncharacterized protein n=1 Tax=Protopolystoma xenopodis TaxID=117903 RepID=A0A3S5C569_9PLAT|nr:unnamed protein product [Protopolystoma xenopodis]